MNFFDSTAIFLVPLLKKQKKLFFAFKWHQKLIPFLWMASSLARSLLRRFTLNSTFICVHLNSTNGKMKKTKKKFSLYTN